MVWDNWDVLVRYGFYCVNDGIFGVVGVLFGVFVGEGVSLFLVGCD